MPRPQPHGHLSVHGPGSGLTAQAYPCTSLPLRPRAPCRRVSDTSTSDHRPPPPPMLSTSPDRQSAQQMTEECDREKQLQQASLHPFLSRHHCAPGTALEDSTTQTGQRNRWLGSGGGHRVTRASERPPGYLGGDGKGGNGQSDVGFVAAVARLRASEASSF